AETLFGIDGIERVFFGSDFVTVTKREDKEWAVVKPAVLGAIMDHYTAGKPILIEGAEAPKAVAVADGENAEIVEQIIELIDTRVRPAVAQDGGDIVFKDFKDGVVTLHMQGSCSGCPSSTATLKMGIENMLKHYIPEVIEVRAEA
ncbi:MAG: NifU family protein, partial [Alphaproteobacteria bacterium]|nr:NifU family protein [Alphaproteobacteria bacterium]